MLFLCSFVKRSEKHFQLPVALIHDHVRIPVSLISSVKTIPRLKIDLKSGESGTFGKPFPSNVPELLSKLRAIYA